LILNVIWFAARYFQTIQTFFNLIQESSHVRHLGLKVRWPLKLDELRNDISVMFLQTTAMNSPELL
jgi:hypothetical protein